MDGARAAPQAHGGTGVLPHVTSQGGGTGGAGSAGAPTRCSGGTGISAPVPPAPLSTTESSVQELHVGSCSRTPLDTGAGERRPPGRGPACSPCTVRRRQPRGPYPAPPARPSWTWNAASGWCWALSWEAAELKGRETAFCFSCPGTYEEWPDAGATSSPQPGSPRTRGMRSRTAAGSY